MANTVGRIMAKLDEYFARNDYKTAGEYLDFWYSETDNGKDDNTLFFVTNELIGFHRKQGNRDKALAYCKKVLQLCNAMNIENTAAAATAYINVATAYKAFEMSETAMPYFEKAKVIYEKELVKNDSKLAGLYNNMGLALCDLKKYDEAKDLYNKAIEILKTKENGELDSAISYLNMADAVAKEKGMLEGENEIGEFLETAQELLDSKKDLNSGYYAFVCEKCAPTFGYYGYFMYENDLKERAFKIYEGN